MKFFKKKQEPEVISPWSKDLCTYLNSSHNNGVAIGVLAGEEVRLDLFELKKINFNLAVMGSSESRKQEAVKILMKNEEKKMNRYVVTTNGDEYKHFDALHIGKELIVNPFHVIESNFKQRVAYVSEFFAAFGEMGHVSVEKLDAFEKSVLDKVIEDFIDGHTALDTLTLSKFRGVLEGFSEVFERKLDSQMRTFSSLYTSNGGNPYDFYTKNTEKFEFADDVRILGVYKKLIAYISNMDSLGILRYMDGRNSVDPLHEGLTVVDLNGLKSVPENYCLITSLLLDQLEKAAMRKNKTAIYVDSIPLLVEDDDYFGSMLKKKLMNGRYKNISYRIVGVELPHKLLSSCHSFIHAGKCEEKFGRRVFGHIPLPLEEMQNNEGVLMVGKDHYTVFEIYSNKK